MKDLTSLKTYIIDSEDPHEVDDAISIEIKEGNKKIIWIHISNPCRLFLQDSYVDLDARKKNSSLYLTNQYIPMLPLEILSNANLAQNKINQMKEAAIREIKSVSIKIAVDSVKKIISTSVDKSKLDNLFQKNSDETKAELKKINS